MSEERCENKHETITVVSVLFINLVIHSNCLALYIYVFSTLINKGQDKEASCYFYNNIRQHTLTAIKERKAKADLHRRETAARTNLRQQALTEIIKQRKNERKAPSNGDYDTNREPS